MVTWKSTQDRYLKLQERFDREDRRELAMSGIRGESGELLELLSAMKEARDDSERVRVASAAADTTRVQPVSSFASFIVDRSPKSSPYSLPVPGIASSPRSFRSKRS